MQGCVPWHMKNTNIWVKYMNPVSNRGAVYPIKAQMNILLLKHFLHVSAQGRPVYMDSKMTHIEIKTLCVDLQ